MIIIYIKLTNIKYLQFILDAHLEHLKSRTIKSRTGATPTLMHGGNMYNLKQKKQRNNFMKGTHQEGV